MGVGASAARGIRIRAWPSRKGCVESPCVTVCLGGGAPREIRTPDQDLSGDLLCPLSYRRAGLA